MTTRRTDTPSKWRLRAAGIIVLVANNGRDALRKASSMLPELIVTDLQMPEMGGEELCHQLKRRPPFAAVPVILAVRRAESRPTPSATGLRIFANRLGIGRLLSVAEAFIAARGGYRRAIPRFRVACTECRADKASTHDGGHERSERGSPRRKAHLRFEASPVAGSAHSVAGFAAACARVAQNGHVPGRWRRKNLRRTRIGNPLPASKQRNARQRHPGQPNNWCADARISFRIEAAPQASTVL